MPDLLAHTFIAYSVCRVLSWRFEWISSPYLTLGMVGAFIPDLVKVRLLLPGRTVEQLLGIPFAWGSLHTGGGLVVSILIGVVLLSASERRKGGVMLTVGAVSHSVADMMLLTPMGRSNQQLLWPLLQYKIPSPGLYLSTQPEPTLVTGVVAGIVWLIHRSQMGDRPEV
ncbi:metal-dependent hydrolase [Halobellus rubicundus]|uniref:Metal-dependent hydrolase n=1 Tax=Halobellus rubicundus TaxID=2996466 RepID=A0ABD5MCT7_9EURY